MSEPLSNTQLKNRLLGAALLVVLAVLLIPLFLGEPKQTTQESATVSSSSEFKSKIQPLSETGEQSLDTLNNANERGSEGGLVLKKIDTFQADSKNLVASEPAQKKVKTTIAKPLPLERKVAPPKVAQKTVVEKPAKKEEKPKAVAKTVPKPKPKPKSKPAQSDIEAGWAVQAGIFSKLENAQSIARILKSNGHAPKVSDTKASFGKATRVWLGPFSSKKEAQALSVRIEKQTGDGGYVAPFPFKS